MKTEFTNMKEMKEALKHVANELKLMKTKEYRREHQYLGGQYRERIIANEYRLVHIAYSLMKGKTYEQIEQKCRENNEPDLDIINSVLRKNDGWYNDSNRQAADADNCSEAV